MKAEKQASPADQNKQDTAKVKKINDSIVTEA